MPWDGSGFSIFYGGRDPLSEASPVSIHIDPVVMATHFKALAEAALGHLSPKPDRPDAWAMVMITMGQIGFKFGPEHEILSAPADACDL